MKNLKMLMMLTMILVFSLVFSACGDKTENKETEIKTTEISNNSNESLTSVQETETDPMETIYRLDIVGDGSKVSLENKETDEWCYTVYKKDDIGWIHVYQYKGNDRNIVVPKSFDDFPVVAVLDPRMYTVTKYDPDLESFTRAYDTSEITSVAFPDTIYKTYGDIFTDTVWYRNQPDGEVYIGNVFLKFKGKMSNETVVNVKEGTLGVCEKAFYECNNLEKVNLPDSVIYLDDLVFAYCESLKEVTLSKNIIGMRMKVFRDTTNLKELHIPVSLSFSYKTFEKSNLEKVYFEGTLNQWNNIYGIQGSNNDFELKTDTPFPY